MVDLGKKFNKKIYKTFFFYFFLLFFISVISFIFIFVQDKTLFINAKKGRILSFTEERASHIRTLLDNHVALVKDLSASPGINSFTSASPKDKDFVFKKNDAQDRVNKSIQANAGDILEIIILDNKGKVILTNNNNNTPVGSDRSQDEYFIKAINVPYFIKDIYYSETLKRNNYTISVPIENKDTSNLEAVIVVRFNEDSLYKIIENRTGLDKTGETFLINKDLYFISPSYFLGNDVLFTKKVETQNAKDCFKPSEISEIKNNGYSSFDLSFVGDYIDYRGQKIYGTHMYIPETGWCLIGKIDKSEVNSLFNLSGYTIVFSGVFLLFVIIFVIFFIMRKIVRPIELLTKGSEEIGDGDINYKFDFKSNNELGRLAFEFNVMTEKIRKNELRLKEYSKNLENTVEDRTKGLTEKIEEISKTREAILNIAEDAEKEKERFGKERDKLDTILHSIGDGVFVVDRNLEVILVNDTAASMTGFSADEILGKKYSDRFNFIFEDTGKINDEFIKNVFETKKVQEMSRHTVLIRKDGTRIQAADSAAPLFDGGMNIIGCVVVFRDVSKEREVDRAKTEFVSLASHQLRTPLSSINWYTEMLLSGDAGELNDEQKKYLNEVYTGNQRMVELVNALLDVSRLELGTFIVEPEIIDLSKLIQDVAKEQKPQIDAKKLKFDERFTENLPKINADPKLLHIVFQNLLSNAIKYTPEEGLINFNVRFVKIGENVDGRKVNEDSIMIAVSDTGYGIPDYQQDKIFSKLFRADNIRGKETEGTGLGLYIVKAVVEHSGGQIWFESKENKGTTFYITLPLAGMKKKEGTAEIA